jgi:light-regulated signal transduction histidine kinase (bacteriophytochrome)
VSHDLRAPLRALDGFSRLLVEDYGDLLDEQGREYLARIRRNSQRMGELIDDLLELSRVSRAEVRRSLTNLSDLARDIARELTAEAPDRHVMWVIPEGLWADADPGLARVVLENLLRNAWKFTRLQAQPRIEIGQSCSTVRLPLFRARQRRGLRHDLCRPPVRAVPAPAQQPRIRRQRHRACHRAARDPAAWRPCGGTGRAGAGRHLQLQLRLGMSRLKW